MNPLSDRAYLPEIDSLRAIAVMSVVIYHAAESFAPGGFIGVDIFFVVSGFVISRRYLFDLIEKKVRGRDFFLARFRRLALPAFTVLAVSTAAAAVLLTPPDLLRYATSLIAQPFYLQNFVFWEEGDYFESALAKPLLHTWSLAVEEQFYILFVLCIMLFRRRIRLLFIVFIAMALMSWAVGAILEPRSPKTVFFMLPTRIWEFALGVMAFLIVRRWPALGVPFANPLILLGMIWLVIVAIAFDKSDPFPGFHSVSACLVTAGLLILIETQQGQLHGFFRNSVATHLGKISYSFYLWHWPPLAFFFLTFNRPASALEGLALCGLAYGLTLATVWAVETPIRSRKVLGQGRTLMFTVAAAGLACVAIAWGFKASNGLLLRYPPDVRLYFEAATEKGNFRCSKIYVLQNPGAEICPLHRGSSGSKAVLILGDSHADMLKEVVVDVAREADASVYITLRNCDVGEYALGGFCSPAVRKKVMEAAQRAGVSDIIVISRWTKTRGTAEGFAEDMAHLMDTGLQVSFTETIPYDATHDPVERAQAALAGQPLNTQGLDKASLAAHLAPMRSLITPLVEQYGEQLNVLTPSDYLCDGGCDYVRDGKPIYFDATHLSLPGAKLLAPMFQQVIGTNKDP